MKEIEIEDSIAGFFKFHNIDINELLKKIMEDWDYYSGELI